MNGRESRRSLFVAARDLLERFGTQRSDDVRRILIDKIIDVGENAGGRRDIQPGAIMDDRRVPDQNGQCSPRAPGCRLCFR